MTCLIKTLQRFPTIQHLVLNPNSIRPCTIWLLPTVQSHLSPLALTTLYINSYSFQFSNVILRLRILFSLFREIIPQVLCCLRILSAFLHSKKLVMSDVFIFSAISFMSLTKRSCKSMTARANSVLCIIFPEPGCLAFRKYSVFSEQTREWWSWSRLFTYVPHRMSKFPYL